MRRLWMVGIGLMMTATVWAGGIPAQITYQGTLKEKGLPAGSPTAVTKIMLFRLTNLDGTQVYWSSGNMSVTVANGLFSADLVPTNVDWQNITPYIEVSVQGQQLSPREPVAASVYAMMSQSIVDGAVTPAKVASGYGLVPSGAIMMFSATCPTGWTRFSALDNRFPMGDTTYGTIGGSTSHTHTISIDGAHNHGGITGSPIGLVNVNAGSNALVPTQTHTHNITNDGAHNHGGSTASAGNLPPYLGLLFCQKQ